MITTASSPGPHPDETPHASPSIIVLLTWLIVLAPLAWGVYNTVNTSTKLFTSSPPPEAAQPAGATK